MQTKLPQVPSRTTAGEAGVQRCIFLTAATVLLVAVSTATAAPWETADATRTHSDYVKNCEIYSFGDIDIGGPFKIFAGDPDETIDPFGFRHVLSYAYRPWASGE